MRILLLDNYDSFTFNLVQAFAALGAEVVVRRNDAVSVADALEFGSGAIVLSPGPRGPADAGISVPLVRAAAAAAIPLLGVCLGHQAIGEAFGARVVRAPRPVHGQTSVVVHDGTGLLEGSPAAFDAMRYHSLAVAEPLPSALRATAWTGDAARVLMAMEHRELPIHGVQFHPESFLTPTGPALLERFLRIAAAARRAPLAR